MRKYLRFKLPVYVAIVLKTRPSELRALGVVTVRAVLNTSSKSLRVPQLEWSEPHELFLRRYIESGQLEEQIRRHVRETIMPEYLLCVDMSGMKIVLWGDEAYYDI